MSEQGNNPEAHTANNKNSKSGNKNRNATNNGNPKESDNHSRDNSNATPNNNNEGSAAASNSSVNLSKPGGARNHNQRGGGGGHHNNNKNQRYGNRGGNKRGGGHAPKRGRSGGEEDESGNNGRRRGGGGHHKSNTNNNSPKGSNHQGGGRNALRTVLVGAPTPLKGNSYNCVLDTSDDGSSVASSASPRFLSDQTLPPQTQTTTGTNTTPYARPRRQPPPTAATPEGVSPLQDPAVYVSPYVRVVAEREETNTTVRTLESLLKYGTANIGTEEDTPFLGPMLSGPSGHRDSASGPSALQLNGPTEIANLNLEDDLVFQGNESIVGKPATTAAKPPSPGLKFSLDGVATPNTWGAIGGIKGLLGSIPNMVSLPPSTDPADYGGYGHTDFSSGLSANKSVATPETSMYRFLMNDYNRETDTFRYRGATPEAKAKFMSRITDLCTKVSSILENECLMCAVPTPVYVLGDVHGNFCDLSYFLKSVLAFNDIHLSPCNVLCLGDYVDRGPYSLECVLLLFALKATAPHKVTLLRGNHEDRVVCGDRRTYGNDCFLAQCQTIFGMAEGLGVFLTVTEVFRHLPLAAEIVISNAPNNPQAPRDLADEDDWESVPNTSSLEPYGNKLPNATGANNTPLSSLNTGAVCPPTPQTPSSFTIPKTPKNAFGIEHSSPRDVRRMFTDRNWLRRQTHVERILCTHGGIPRFNCPPKESDSLAFLRSSSFPRLLTLFPNNPFMRDHQPAEVERFKNVPEEVMQRAWFTMFDLMWSDPTVDDTNVNEWGFGINTRGNTVVSFSTKAVETFLDAFKYSMLFRAHQEKAHGIRLSKSKKVLTIFSTSNYLGHGNGAGCAVVSPYGEIQLIVKTSE